MTVVRTRRLGLAALGLMAAVAGCWTGAGLWAAEGGATTTSRPAATMAASAAATEKALVGGVVVTTEARAEVTKLPAAPTTPKTVEDLKLIQARVEAVVKLTLPAVVSIQFDYAQGSGVIVSKDGYVLTAGHVSGTPGQTMRVVLADGRRVRAKALGANNGIDSGMLKILDAGEYPFVPVGSTKKLTAGQWVVAMGHPGGYVPGRPPVVRLGRVLLATTQMIATDSPLISGDSGGPVFDLDGLLIGINSRIGATTTQNIHVPIDTFLETWDRLAKGDEWGGGGGFFDFPRGGVPSGGAVLGVKAFADEKGVIVRVVHPGTPAGRSGLLEGDIITTFDGKGVKTPEELAELLGKKRPGQTVTLSVLRESKVVEVGVRLGGAGGGGGRGRGGG